MWWGWHWWAWSLGIKREGKELDRKVRDGRLGLEWEGLRTKERSIDKHTADVKIGHTLLCENTRVLGGRNVPGSVSCPDLFSTASPPEPNSHVQPRRPAPHADTTSLSYFRLAEPSDEMFHSSHKKILRICLALLN